MSTGSPDSDRLIDDPTPEHESFRSMCRDFAAREMAPLVDEAEATGIYPRELLRRAGAAGLSSLSTPVEFGGAGAGPTFLVIAIEELARVCAGLATGLTGGLGQHLLCTVATEEQRERYLGPTLLGEASGAFAITEPDAGSDVLNMKGRAERLDDGRWQLTAQKMYITGAPFADYLFVVNDKRDYGPRVGEFKAMLEKALPQTVTVDLRDRGAQDLVLYDMIERQRLESAPTSSGIQFDVDLPAPGGKIIALLQRPLAQVEIVAPAQMSPGVRCPIDVLIRSDDDTLASGVLPLQLEITDPQGRPGPLSDYYAVKNGVLTVRMTPALNDVPGTWTIKAQDLTAGLTAQVTVELVP